MAGDPDDEPTPPRLRVPPRLPKPRAQSQAERDTPRAGRAPDLRAIPEPIDWDGLTDRYEGPELEAMRAKRPTREWLAKLQKNHNELATTVTDTREIAIRVDGKQDAQTKALDQIQLTLNRIQDDKAHETRVTRELRAGVTAKLVGGAIALLTSGWFLHWLATK